jgi:hypothetical protein
VRHRYGRHLSGGQEVWTGGLYAMQQVENTRDVVVVRLQDSGDAAVEPRGHVLRHLIKRQNTYSSKLASGTIMAF